MTPRPRIAVTTSKRSGWRIFPLVALNLWLAGGRAVRWGTGRNADLDCVDGLVIGGGDDISPHLYGMMQMVAAARLDPARDALERDLIKAAIARDMPVLGICRGAQMINVALGGTLHQNAYEVHAGSDRHWTILPRKQVNVCPRTRLAAIAGTDKMRVNALHSQAIDRLGRDLCIAAHDRGGMIQAVERTRDPFALGVQWHPEHLVYARRQRAIFAALVAAARAGRTQSVQLRAVDALAQDPTS
ncbi:putative glutamine amidotransferase [Rhodovulum bhavnagarense]|uniref:Putative glutamine amidotransferase n=1 Tax=Rhodovulum bhavnagarense TaxID=992286 RepID=A0A4R2RH95_9RHOB|nr:gamma-glutamyl-gamma-aminobutyrate hydrolase family protein [Rhodovulum bhavnagarense]TCP61978.1 putative glutamine amidotransferase [Rhodovulum bhavnagarense]